MQIRTRLGGLAAALTLTLAGCTTAPLSFLVGHPMTKTDMTLYPVRVVSIDGSMGFNQPAEIAPGVREVVFEAAPGHGALNHVQKTYAFKVAPCTRYFLAARRTSPMASDWSLVIDWTERVGHCQPEDEFRKAGLTAPPRAPARPASPAG